MRYPHIALFFCVHTFYRGEKYGRIPKSGHAVYDIKYHVIWVTKYRYQVLRGQVAIRLRELIRQGCEARGVTILQGSVDKEHIHLLISCPPTIYLFSLPLQLAARVRLSQVFVGKFLSASVHPIV